MMREVSLRANVTAPDAARAAALLDPLLAALAEPVTGRPAPESYAWKIPGTWMVSAELAARPAGDARALVAGLTGRLPMTGWWTSGDADAADAVWDAGEDTEPPFPGVTWVSVAAAHPGDPDAEAVPDEELLPDRPAGGLDEGLLEYLRADQETTGRARPGDDRGR
ncbi:hypothetical protein Sru01_05010 [Sphaerisporangium rufum]|uniref:Uncharacterized protein n=1 Tax=Sphaerisporangium rufum TaxID=1381558 RepID=A0A919QWQ2_9ACTN|nr:hypothetical protein [Sphaerisporangium rufum]GII75519.1 hypothetical protein Sru01_05010 [Sphaerisporangium rufum]